MNTEQFIGLTSFFLLISLAISLLFLGLLFCTWRRWALRGFALLLFFFIFYLIKIIMDWSSNNYWTYFSLIVMLPPMSFTFMFKNKEIKDKSSKK